MLSTLFRVLSPYSPTMKRALWRQWYEFLANRYQLQEWMFMNYGYAPLHEDADGLQLATEDELNRYFIQLYHYVASAVDMEDLDVLEIGSGRGGGAAYMKRYLKPQTVTGVDFSEQAVDFCRRNYRMAGLYFLKGDAENLPFPDANFDVVINVESSHCYGSMQTFLEQVRRVLRPGGYFLYADFRRKEGIAQLQDQLAHSGMGIVRQQDITANVVRALELDHERKLAVIQRYCDKWLLKTFQEFAGIKGSKLYENFRCGYLLYQYYVLQK